MARKKSLNKFKFDGRTSLGILFLLPGSLVIFIVTYLPALWNVILSFMEWDGFLVRNWVGFKNYVQSFQDALVFSAMRNSIVLGLGQTFFAVIVGLVLVALIYRMGRFESAVYRLILFIPIMMPLAIIGLLFSFVYNPDMGILNNFLRLIGLNVLTRPWLEDLNTVMPSLQFVGVWRMSGLTMMFYFAAMQLIPPALFEASHIDGASYSQQFFRIVIPLIKPSIQLSAVYSFMVTFKTYDLVKVMTNGGPGRFSQTVPLMMMNTAFMFNEFGYAAALGVELTVVILVIIQLSKLIIRSEYYEY